MKYEIAKQDGEIVYSTKDGRFSIITPDSDKSQSIDREVQEFLENEAHKLLDVIGPDPVLYPHDEDVAVHDMSGMFHVNLSNPLSVHPDEQRPVLRTEVYHVVYYIPGAEFHLTQDIFSMAINRIAVPLLIITDRGYVTEWSTSAHDHNHHMWKGPQQDPKLFESLKRVVNQDPLEQVVNINSEDGPIIFYKLQHQLGQYATQHFREHNPSLLPAP
ncbi:MAG: hypothetical protein KKC75_08760 [Nanoarchaeota archaeon]|nr:hypothetical protein [Nanoarchaeota archaeon]MBU1004969.1 hypothetical protein [Nanoarchaeota archaeon]MBU1946391.1 hypothetical protein [Nanoarchaeota archaeon]